MPDSIRITVTLVDNVASKMPQITAALKSIGTVATSTQIRVATANQQMATSAAKTGGFFSNLKQQMLGNLGALDKGFVGNIKNSTLLNNSFFQMTRILARLRTIFFLFVTLLAVRPVIRIFEDIAQSSQKVQDVLNDIDAKFKARSTSFARDAQPFFEAVKAFIEDLKITLLQFFLNHAKLFANIIRFFGYLYGIVRNIYDVVTRIIGDLSDFIVNTPAFQILKDVKNAIETIQGLWRLAHGDKSSLLPKVFSGKPVTVTGNLPFPELPPSISNVANALESLQGKRFRVAGEESAKDYIIAFQEGIVNGIPDILQLVGKMGKDIQNALVSGLSDTFLNIMQSKFNKFRDILVNTLHSIQKAIADFIANIIYKRALAVGIDKILGLVTGVALTGGPSAGSYADTGASGEGGFGGQPVSPQASPGSYYGQHGGIFTRPTFRILGEAGPERVSRLGTPYFPMGQRSSGQTVVFNINAIDEASVSDFFIRNAAKVRQIVTKGAVGGDSTLRTAFNLR